MCNTTLFSEKELYKEIVRSGKDLINVALSPQEITKWLRTSVNKFQKNVVFKTLRHPDVLTGNIAISGDYDKDADLNSCPCIFVDLYYAKEKHQILFNDAKIKRLAVDIVECIGHESVRRNLIKSRNYVENPLIFVSCTEDDALRDDQMYFGQPDSVEAFSYSVAASLYLSTSKNKITSNDIYSNEIFQTYVSRFGPNHRIVGDLLLLSLKYYQQLIMDDGSTKREQTKQTELSTK